MTRGCACGSAAGTWVGELSTSALSTAVAIIALRLVDRDAHANLIDAGLAWLAAHQNPDGGWGDTVRSLSNISTTMLCRAALHICDSRDQDARSRCKQWVGERYGRSMLNDLNNWAVGWIDWNMLLDEQGGPNHAGNFCCAPVIADTRTGEVQYESSYYYIGHFSRFIRPGAHRVQCATSHDALHASAFLNTDGRLVVVALNLSDEPLSFHLKLNGQETAAESLPHSIATYVSGEAT